MNRKVILINGAGRRLGRTVAEALARRGAAVAANDLSPITLEWTQPLEAEGYAVRAYTEDPTRKIVAQALVKQVEEEWGRIDVLIHVAAIAPQTSLLELDEWDWHRSLDLNLSAAFLLVQSVGRIMRQQGNGLIFLLLNLDHMQAQEHPAFFIAQMGLWGLAVQARQELAKDGIRVEMLSNAPLRLPDPPLTPTPLLEYILEQVERR